MTSTKPWWQSRTVWASIIAMLCGIASLAGVSLDARLQDDIATLAVSLADIAAAAIALIGRIRAEARITWRRA